VIGDLSDFTKRLRLTLPAHWFSDVAPVLDGVLDGISAAWSSLYSLLEYVRGQTRIGTASDQFLDLAAADFLGAAFSRRLLETDAPFRARMLKAMRRQRVTRTALDEAAAANGFRIDIFEAARPADTGAYNVPSGLAWGSAGGWGSLNMPFECLIVAHPGADAVPSGLWTDIATAMPVGGAAWLRIAG